MLHPRDRKTGVKYRLLPMTRGIISGLFTPEQVKDHLSVIRRHLLFPDGVRLMDRPLPYRGGVEKYFKRAESAANFGREISLQYVHAHIRYIEAMAVLGEAEALYEGLLAITPITLHRVFSTAEFRQSNAYFSSSDAAFADRYEAHRHFSAIKKLQVPINGGWRVYSSGPGMYFHQVVSMFLGLRRHFEDVVFDPVIPQRLSGLEFDFEQDGKNVRYTYHVKEKMFSPNRVVVNGHDLDNARYSENRYRHGGFLINHDILDKMLNQEQNWIEIYL
jgi:cellobiose phosphorylase